MGVGVNKNEMNKIIEKFIVELEYRIAYKKQPLTDDEIMDIAKKYDLDSFLEFTADNEFKIYTSKILDEDYSDVPKLTELPNLSEPTKKEECGKMSKTDMNDYIIDLNTMDAKNFIKKYC